MTIDALHGEPTHAAGRDERSGHPIGELDANIFNCPACARPLGVGTRRCPGCATRLIGGVRATRAIGFIGVGLLAGLIVGGGTIAGVWALSRGETAAVIVAAPETVAAPGAAVSPLPVATIQPPAAGSTASAAARSALRQSSLLNQRLADDAAKLGSALAVAQPSTAEIAKALRALAATAAFGDRIAPDVAGWPAATDVSADLVELYAAVGRTARAGLAASLTNTGAYVDAGRAMLAITGDMAALDAAAASLAASAGP
ncbi:MAG: hypothetical protein OEV61_11905 [Chloroflexota bacterium]|jgi:hypothetical protein|nr:hypothetical protein [Chloroflexota bacterium]MDH5242553.1 hypothetical protein [Chloroflexota bacterium]